MGKDTRLEDTRRKNRGTEVWLSRLRIGLLEVGFWRSVMIACLGEEDAVVLHAIDEAVFLGDAA